MEIQKNTPLLKVNNLSKMYGELAAVKDANFHIPQGYVTGLVGPNGAGKTTLIKCIIGFLNYTGDMTLMGAPRKKMNRALIGYLAEDEGYYPSWTGYEYLEYFGELYHLPDVDGRVSETLEIVGLHGRKYDKISEYSNGMRKRLGIARTMLHKPKLLIYDEPLAGLDPMIKGEMMDIIESIAGDNNSVLISSHQLNDIEEACNWIVMINEGVIKDFGEPFDVLKRTSHSKKLVLNIDTADPDRLKDLNDLPHVVGLKLSGKTLVIEGKGSEKFEKDVFRWLIDNDVEFSLKHGSLDSIYRGSLK